MTIQLPAMARKPLARAMVEAREDAAAFRQSADALHAEATRRAAQADAFEAQAAAIEAFLGQSVP